jgi:hypothetical protein
MEYWLLTTYPRERWYRQWWLMTHRDLSHIERYASLAEKYPHGLSHLPELPEERSGEVSRLGLVNHASAVADQALRRAPASVAAVASVLEGAAV